MKVSKTEKIWLACVCAFYGLYNLPNFPAYKDSKTLIVHAALTIVPLWVSVYIGLSKVNKLYRIKSGQER